MHIKELELRHLRQFVAVAEELSFRRAAARLNMSQPPLTMAVKQVESIVGTALFERSRRRVELTPAGQAFLLEAHRTLAQAQVTVQSAQRAAKGLAGVLRISFVGSAALSVMPPLLRRFSRTYPSVELILDSESSAKQIMRLRNGDIDLALIVSPFPEARDLRVSALRTESMVLAVPSDHPVAQAGTAIKLEGLRDEAFITFRYADGPGFVSEFVESCRNAGFHPRVARESTQLHTILAMVAGGIGWGVLPESMRVVAVPEVTYVEFDASVRRPRYTLAFAMRSGGSNPIAETFISMAAEFRSRSDVIAAAQAVPLR